MRIINSQFAIRFSSLAIFILLGWCVLSAVDEKPESGSERKQASVPTTAAVRHATSLESGLALVIGTDAELACELAKGGKWLVHLLAIEADSVEPLRAVVQSRGLGGRVIVQPLPGDGHLPHPDRFVNLAIADLDELSSHALKRTEIERVLAVRGAAYLRQGGEWHASKAPQNARLDGWTHRYYDASNNCVSRDRVAAVPLAVQWQHGPAFEDGTADGKVPRIADGHFVTFDGQSGDLVCRDASNGSLLWRRYVGSPQAADLAVVAGQVYLYLDPNAKPGDTRRGNTEQGPLVALDLATGQVVKTYDEALRAGAAAAVATPHHEDEKRIEKYHPVPWFIVREDVIVQAYGPELRVLDRASGRRRFSKLLAAELTWFSPALSGDFLLAAEAVGVGRRGRHDGATHVQAVAAFDVVGGEPKWRNEDAHPLRTIEDSKRGPLLMRAEFKPLSLADGLALLHVSSYQFRHGGRLAVLDAGTGRQLWHRDFEPKTLYDQGSQRAILRNGEVVILDGLGARRFVARTGETIGDPIALPKDRKRQTRPNGACTASRATADWLICNAYLYVGPDDQVAHCFGARGACGQGVVPANGLMYVNPTPCDCGDYTRGYEAMAGQRPGRPVAADVRLTRGPAFAASQSGKLTLPKNDWPIFLGDKERRSSVVRGLPEELSILWQKQVSTPRRDAWDADRRQSERYLGLLSAPVSASEVAVVAALESHFVEAREAATGKLRWTFPTPGKVDSPPTLVLDAEGKQGLAIFGCDDGAVYALRLSDGALAWRFAAAPTDGVAMQHGHLASAMTLPGSVLVVGDTVVVSAGQHTDLGGLHFYALDAATGRVRARRIVNQDQPAVVTNDVLVADASDTLWLGNGQSMLHFSADLESLPIPTTKTGAAANRPPIAFDRQGTRVRFRTDLGRGGSTHGWGGAMRTRFAAAHRIATADGITYALRDPTANDRHVVRAAQVPLIMAGRDLPEKQMLWSTSIAALGNRESYSSLIKAGNRLYLGGGNRAGSAGFVQVIDAETGDLIATHELPSRVTECGLAAAGGQLLVSCEGGELICFAARR